MRSSPKFFWMFSCSTEMAFEIVSPFFSAIKRRRHGQLCQVFLMVRLLRPVVIIIINSICLSIIPAGRLVESRIRRMMVKGDLLIRRRGTTVVHTPIVASKSLRGQGLSLAGNAGLELLEAQMVLGSQSAS